MPSVHLERHKNPCGTLRLYDEGSFENGDPYRLALTAEIEGYTVTLRGADVPVTARDYRNIRAYLIEQGYRKVIIQRHGRMKTIKLEH